MLVEVNERKKERQILEWKERHYIPALNLMMIHDRLDLVEPL